MSVNWERYASAPGDCLQHARKPVSEYAVVSFLAGDARTVPGQTVVHVPDYPNNRAHAEVRGVKETEQRLRFLLIYRVHIALP
jgi:hypothetical protein